MTKVELIAAFRSYTGDLFVPYLWSDAEITTYLNESEAEAALRAKLLVDSTTDAYCKIVLVALTSTYATNALVLEITRAKIGTTILSRTTVEDLDTYFPGWEETTGTPTFYIFDGKNVRLYPNPTAIANLQLTIERMPIVMGTSPEINARYHPLMMDWAYHLAYSKRDVDTLDNSLSAKHEDLFIRSFGERPSANVQRKQLRHRPTMVRNNGDM